MKLLNVDNIDNTVELLKTVYGAWEQITNILNNCFPDMTDDDWDNVKASELLPVFVMILKYSFTQMLTIPTDKEKLDEGVDDTPLFETLFTLFLSAL